MKVAIYCRVSTEEQELQQQILACQKFCEYKKLDYDTYSEIGSGNKSDRPTYQELLKKLRSQQYQGLVLFRFDRLGRNAREIVTIFEELENKGIQVYSLNENIDTTNPIGRAIRDIICRLAQLERENLSEATKHRLQALKNMGKKLGRPTGSKDHKQRKKTGYFQRWQKNK